MLERNAAKVLLFRSRQRSYAVSMFDESVASEVAEFARIWAETLASSATNKRNTLERSADDCRAGAAIGLHSSI